MVQEKQYKYAIDTGVHTGSAVLDCTIYSKIEPKNFSK